MKGPPVFVDTSDGPQMFMVGMKPGPQKENPGPQKAQITIFLGICPNVATKGPV